MTGINTRDREGELRRRFYKVTAEGRQVLAEQRNT